MYLQACKAGSFCPEAVPYLPTFDGLRLIQTARVRYPFSSVQCGPPATDLVPCFSENHVTCRGSCLIRQKSPPCAAVVMFPDSLPSSFLGIFLRALENRNPTTKKPGNIERLPTDRTRLMPHSILVKRQAENTNRNETTLQTQSISIVRR